MRAEIGIWPVRVESEKLAEALAERLGGELFRPWRKGEAAKAELRKEESQGAESQGAESQRDLFRLQFAQRSQWVLVMATGIAVRFVDGLLRDKHRDPAVVVLDEAGRYAIALVGGHEGGANELAYRVASAVGAIPVVTTATEADKSLVVGIGCRKGVSEEQIERAVLHALGLRGAALRQRQVAGGREGAGEHEGAGGRGAGRGGDNGGEDHAAREFAHVADLSAVREIATIDLKAEEPGLVALCQRRGIPLRIIARHQIMGRPWVSKPSAWVRQTLGVEGVCEPCALIASTRGRLVVPKVTLDGVAVAIVDDEWELGS